MTRFFKKSSLWFTLYGILITAVFLYLLFPGDIIKDRLEATLSSPELIFRASSLKPSLPLGIKFKNPALIMAAPGDVLFQAETLDLQPGLLSLLTKITFIKFSGKAYNGSFDGNIGLTSLINFQQPAAGKINFQNIDLAKLTIIKDKLGRSCTGRMSGILQFQENDRTNKNPAGSLQLFLARGSLPLAEPFLGMTKLDYDRGEIKAELKNGIARVEKLEISGVQINCILKGEITVAPVFKDSRLNLTGFIEILGKNKAKMNINIGGTLANPVSRYI